MRPESGIALDPFGPQVTIHLKAIISFKILLFCGLILVCSAQVVRGQTTSQQDKLNVGSTVLAAPTSSTISDAQTQTLSASLASNGNNLKLDGVTSNSFEPSGVTLDQTAPAAALSSDSTLDDIVISSSEILSDKQKLIPQHSETAKGSDKLSVPNECQPEISIDCRSKQSKEPESESDDLNAPSRPQREDFKYSHSRLLFRFFLSGLFALVLLSLVVVYAIKYCICARRKRQISLLRQRDLVADSSSLVNEVSRAGGCQFQPIHFSMCQSQAQLPALFGSPNVSQVSHLAESECLCRLPIYMTANQASSGAPCQSRPHQQSPPPQASHSILYRCPTAPDTSNLIEPPPSHLEESSRRHPASPPAYSELFGHEQVSRSESHREFRPTSSTIWPQMESPSLSSDLSSCRIEPTESSERSLLVRLDLNKTRLLSASDLMLLSKLIDVPIVIEGGHQARVGGPEMALYCTSSNSSSRPTTTTETSLTIANPATANANSDDDFDNNQREGGDQEEANQAKSSVANAFRSPTRLVAYNTEAPSAVACSSRHR